MTDGRTARRGTGWLVASAVAAMATTILAMGWLTNREPTRTPLAEPEFFSIDVFVDSRGQPLAAWQLEIADTNRIAQLVGVEGGSDSAYAKPPRYDPAALQQHRVVLASLATGAEHPSGRIRVATLHFAREVAGTPKFNARILAAARSSGAAIDARVEIVQ